MTISIAYCYIKFLTKEMRGKTVQQTLH
jgi:hypothetical protein